MRGLQTLLIFPTLYTGFTSLCNDLLSFKVFETPSDTFLNHNKIRHFSGRRAPSALHICTYLHKVSGFFLHILEVMASYPFNRWVN